MFKIYFLNRFLAVYFLKGGENENMKIKNLITSFVVGAVMFGSVSASAMAANVTVYDALPSVDPQTSYPSQPFQAQQTAEFGDYIHLGGIDRKLDKVTVTMVTWARYSEYVGNPLYSGNAVNWTHPITLNVYGSHLGANGVPDQLLGTVTQNAVVPWRPEGDPSCPNTGYGVGFAWKDVNGTCRNGLAFNATFNLNSLGIVLPDDVIVSVAYNTETWGYQPIGTSGPYNSLNVAVPENQTVLVGSDDSNSEVFWNTSTAAWYTDGGASGVGIFRKDTNWSPYGTVAFKLEVEVPDPVVGPPTKEKECKKDGWKQFNNPTFKNQGQCVSYVEKHNKKPEKPDKKEKPPKKNGKHII